VNGNGGGIRTPGHQASLTPPGLATPGRL